MVEDFATLAKDIHLQIQKARQTPHGINPREFTPNHMAMKLPKTKYKGKILKVSREK